MDYMDQAAIEDLQRGTAINTRMLFEGFLHNFSSLQRIAQSVQEKLNRWELYRKRADHPLLLYSYLFVIWLAFCSGIIYPLLGGPPFQCVIIGIPLVVYTSAILYLTISVIMKFKSS